MSKFSLPYFGELNIEDLGSLKKSLVTRQEYKRNPVRFSIDLEPHQITLDLLKGVHSILSSLHRFDELNKKYLNDNFNKKGRNGSETRFYINSLFEDREEDLDDYIDFEIDTPSTIQILNKLHITGVSINPLAKEYHITFDYSIDEHLTNDILVLWLNLTTRTYLVGIES